MQMPSVLPETQMPPFQAWWSLKTGMRQLLSLHVHCGCSFHAAGSASATRLALRACLGPVPYLGAVFGPCLMSHATEAVLGPALLFAAPGDKPAADRNNLSGTHA